MPSSSPQRTHAEGWGTAKWAIVLILIAVLAMGVGAMVWRAAEEEEPDEAPPRRAAPTVVLDPARLA